LLSITKADIYQLIGFCLCQFNIYINIIGYPMILLVNSKIRKSNIFI